MTKDEEINDLKETVLYIFGILENAMILVKPEKLSKKDKLLYEAVKDFIETAPEWQYTGPISHGPNSIN